MPTIKQLEIIRKKEFVIAALNTDNKISIVYIAALVKLIIILNYSFCKASVTLLISTKILTKYSDFLDIFSSDSTVKLLENIRINNYSINLLKDKQPPYSPIYSLELVELEMLKIYIKANLTSDVIKLFKFPASFLILFIQKKDNSLYLCIDYWGFNNMTIKISYLLLLIGELFNYLNYTKCFT